MTPGNDVEALICPQSPLGGLDPPAPTPNRRRTSPLPCLSGVIVALVVQPWTARGNPGSSRSGSWEERHVSYPASLLLPGSFTALTRPSSDSARRHCRLRPTHAGCSLGGQCPPRPRSPVVDGPAVLLRVARRSADAPRTFVGAVHAPRDRRSRRGTAGCGRCDCEDARSRLATGGSAGW